MCSTSPRSWSWLAALLGPSSASSSEPQGVREFSDRVLAADIASGALEVSGEVGRFVVDIAMRKPWTPPMEALEASPLAGEASRGEGSSFVGRFARPQPARRRMEPREWSAGTAKPALRKGAVGPAGLLLGEAAHRRPAGFRCR